MSNVAQNEISNSRLKKGKEKVGEGSSKKRSDVWNYFTKEPDGQKAKCQYCAQLLCCDPKKHGTSQLRNHHNFRCLHGICPKRRKKAPDGNIPKRPKNAAKSALLLNSSEFPENQLGAQRNTELSGYEENNLECVPQINEEILRSDQRIHQYEINLGHGTQNNQGIPRHQRIHSEYDARTNRENHSGLEQHINPEIRRSEESVYDPRKNRELFVRMIIDNGSMFEHVDNPFLKEFAMTLQPDYSPMTRRDVEKGCLNFYQKEKAVLKDKFGKLTSKISISEVTHKNSITFVATHFIDEDFKLVKRIIDFDYVGLLHDPKRTLNDWGLPEKCYAFTKTNTWSNLLNNNVTLKVNCILQCFHSIADVFYSKIRPEIMSIKLMMRDLNAFPEKMCYFNQIASYHNLAPKFQFLDYRSGVMGPEIYILKDACEYKNVVSTFGDMNIRWSELEEIFGFLKQINDVVGTIASLELPTSNLLHKFVFRIHDVLSRDSPVLPSTKEAINGSRKILNSYLNGCNKIMLIASLLDPRFKLRFIDRCDELNICKKEESFECFNNLFIEYLGQSIQTHTPNCWEQIPELNNYLLSRSVDGGDENFDVLGWWKDNKSEYPILSTMARDILAIPISSTICSGAEPVNEIIDEIFDAGIDEEMSKVLACCNNWLRSDCSTGKFVAGIENIIEKSHVNQPEHSNKGTSCTYDEKKCNELLVKLVISSKIPFHCVESTWFIEWAKNLQSSYSTIIPATIMTDCLCFYQKERQRLQDDLKKHVGKVCFSAHNSSEYPYQYIYVAIHYIDNHFKLVRRTVGMDICLEYTEKIRPRQVERHITSWGNRIEVLAFVRNENLYNEDIGGKYSLKLICGEQLFISLVGLIWVHFYRVMDSFSNIISSKDSRLSTFYDEAKNRFNFLQFYDAVACNETLELFNLYGERFLSIEKWDELKSAVKFLKPIYEAFNILSSSQYPVSNLYLKIVFEIRDVLSYVVQNTNFEVLELEDLLERIDANLKGCNNILLVASLLDPRFKRIYMDRCYRDKDEIDKYISELLHKYEISVRQECEFPYDAESQLGMPELERYLEHNHEEVRDAEFDVLRWWEDNKSTYPTLARMARDILAIPVFSFSPYAADLVIEGKSEGEGEVNITYSGFYKFANQFGPKTFEMMVCCHNWLSVACDNEETTYGDHFQNRGTIDLAKKYIPPSYQCPLRVCDVFSLNYLKYLGLLGEMSKEMVAIGVGILTAKKMQRLIKPFNIYGRSRCIPDDVINCYIGIMNNQKDTSGNRLVLNTIDTQQLEAWASLKDENEKPCECIKRGNDFLEKELVFLPIHLNKHWFVGVLNALKKEFQILNSLNSGAVPHDEATNKLRSGIQVCIDAALDSKGISLRWRPEKILNWPISVIQNLPQQNDGCSCGLVALKYMQFWDGSKLTSEFSQDDIDLFRKQLVGELIFSDLNERKDVQNEVRKEKMHYYYIPEVESEGSEVNTEDESDGSEVNTEDESEANLSEDDSMSSNGSDDITAN